MSFNRSPAPHGTISRMGDDRARSPLNFTIRQLESVKGFERSDALCSSLSIAPNDTNLNPLVAPSFTTVVTLRNILQIFISLQSTVYQLPFDIYGSSTSTTVYPQTGENPKLVWCGSYTALSGTAAIAHKTARFIFPKSRPASLSLRAERAP